MMLYYARIEKFGMLTITSVIVAILLFIFGMGFLGAPICIAAGVIADLIAKSGKYKSWKKTVISCGMFNLWVSASYLPLILTADSYKQSLIESGFDASFCRYPVYARNTRYISSHYFALLCVWSHRCVYWKGRCTEEL